MKFAIVFALIAVAAADVSHLNQYLPPSQAAAPAAPAFEAQNEVNFGQPSNQYLAPAAPAAQAAPAFDHHQHDHQHGGDAAASFSQQDGYDYQHPN